MSNPAVIKLASEKVGSSKIWMDDNIGESIHLHIDDMRVDLSIEEFSKLSEDLKEILTNLINVEGFNISDFDPVFLAVILWKRLPHLTAVKYDNAQLEMLLAPAPDGRIYSLKDSIGVKALKGNTKVAQGYRKSHHILQTESERMNLALNSIRENGYPWKNHYIILFGDDMIIVDGQHRASSLYYLYGNIEVPVLRLYFDNYKSHKIHKHYNSILFVMSRRISKCLCSVRVATLRSISKVLNIFKKARRKLRF